MQRSPLILENFDNAYSGEKGEGRRWTAFNERTISNVEVLSAAEQPDIIRAKRALRLDYDFRVETTQSGSRRSYCRTYSAAENHLDLRQELADCPDTLIIPDGEYPTHLGVWLYGDGCNAWINGGIVDSNGVMEDIAYGDQDWTGWRFVTGAIPPGLKLPFYVSYPLRLLSGSKTMHGSVWLGSVMAVYGGIDFDALMPKITDIKYDGDIRAYIFDPDDSENNYPASGVDSAAVEVFIDGVMHSKNISLTPDSNGFKLVCKPDFPLCGGFHKVEIFACDKAGNCGSGSAFFRHNEGISWSLADSISLGNTSELKISGIDTAYDEIHIEWAFEGALAACDGAQSMNVKIEQCGDSLSLPLKAGYGLSRAENAGLHCVKAYYTKGAETAAFCLPDLKTRLSANLKLVMRCFSKGFDAQFIVYDKENAPLPGARIFCGGKYLDGFTDENGILTQAGLTDGEIGQGIEAYASYGDDYSYKKKVILSQDYAQALPTNVTLTMRKPGEIGVTWQCGVGVNSGFVQLAKKIDGKTELDDEDALIPALMSPHYTALHRQYTELNAYKAIISGLEAKQTYIYRVGKPSAWSETFTFRMSSEESPLKIAILADTHNYCGNAMESALCRCPDLDFFMHMGDFVGSGGAYDNWLALNEDSRKQLSQNLMLPVIGNHDTMDGDGSHFQMIFATPDNGPPSTRAGLTYYTEIGDALFISMGDVDNELETVVWFQEIISRSDKKWRILYMHSGPYTCYINTEEYERKLGALAQLLNIDLVLSGHDHVYHRATIRDNVTQAVGSQINREQGVTYLQCGSSGHGREVPTCEEDHRPIWNKVHDSSEAMYTILTITNDSIKINGIELSKSKPEGNLIDEAEIVKS